MFKSVRQPDALKPALSAGCSHDRRLWDRYAIALIAVLLVGRVIYAACVPLDLVSDEAYYWDWSRQLDWGYYSKPPMIAWLIALSTSCFGSTALAVRLPAIVLSTLGLSALYLLGSKMYGRRTAFLATLACALTPGNAAMSLIMTIDAPLLFFWTCALYALWRYLENESDQYAWWLLLTMLTGLGLLSKQTMLALFGGAVLFVTLSRSDRGQLRRRSFWCWMLVSLAFLTPVFWWNMQNDWITASHTRDHFSLADVSLSRHLIQSGEFLLGQLGVLSPVIAVVTMTVLAAAAWQLRKLERRELFLFCFSGIPLLPILVLSLLRRVQPNWPAPFYTAAILLMVAWTCRQVPIRMPFLPEPALKRGLAVAGVFTLATYLFTLAPAHFGIAGSRLDLLVRLRNWRELGTEVGASLEKLPQPDRTAVVVVSSRDLTSELAFYLPNQPRVFYWNDSGIIMSQYDLWSGVEDRTGWDMAVITREDERVPENLAARFRQIKRREVIRVPIGHGRFHAYQLWHGEEFGETSSVAREPSDTGNY